MSDRIEPGYYKGRAVAGSAQYGLTQNGGDQIALDLDIPATGRVLTTFLFFSDAAAPYAVERLRACGWTGDDITNLVGIDRNEVDIQVKYEMYKGEEKMKVDIATGGGGRVKLNSTMDERQKRGFAARMKSVLAGGSKPANGAAPARQAAPQPVHGDDEIPF